MPLAALSSPASRRAGPVRRRRLVLLAALATLASCGRDADAPRRTQLRVFAAASMREAFTDAEAAFEAAHPQVDVVCSFAGSQVLRTHIEQGAEVDVFASADAAQMAALERAGLVGAPSLIARNGLVVIVPAANPAGITTFADLARAKRLVIGEANVPIGAYTRILLERAARGLGADFADRVRANVASEESNVRLVRAKVELGEADAAIVYRSDAIALPSLRVIAVPAAFDVVAETRVAIASHSRHSEWARRWIEALRGPEMRARLRARGFSPPD